MIRNMKDPKNPKTLNQVRKELAKCYVLAAYASERQLPLIKTMARTLGRMVRAAALAVGHAHLSRRPLPAHWVKFIEGE